MRAEETASLGAERSAASPWLTEQSVDVAEAILNSHRLAFGSPLLAGLNNDASKIQQAQALFAVSACVLAHDGQDPGGEPGPRLIYANRAALHLWRRRWTAMVGMPSRLTADPTQRAGRLKALQSARSSEAIQGYSGIRIDSQGRRFQIDAARLWTLRNSSGQACGQAARFSSWHWLREDPS